MKFIGLWLLCTIVIMCALHFHNTGAYERCQEKFTFATCEHILR